MQKIEIVFTERLLRHDSKSAFYGGESAFREALHKELDFAIDEILAKQKQ